MVELPRHVHRVIKRRAGGRQHVYTFYTRHRNTPQAWPSIAMPEPLSPEFAARLPLVAAMDWDGTEFSLHGVKLPALRTPEFWSKAIEVQRAKDRREHHEARDFTALIEAFKEHEAYQSLSKSTKRQYDHGAELALAAWRYDLPSELTTPIAQQAIDALGETPAAANGFRAFLSRLMSWGIPRGFNTFNPVEHTEKIPGGEPWKPWPEWAFEIFVEHAPFNMLMPAISSFFTGQRQSDVLPMPRPKPSETTMVVRAQKTKNSVWIPIHSSYRIWIERGRAHAEMVAESRRREGVEPMVSPMLHLGVKGLPYQTADGFRSEWGRLMKTEPFKRFREERLVFHGLRKNAVINLLEVGCTEAQVGAIVNMSEQMVRHYGQEADSRRLAQAGMKLLEAGWDTVKVKALAEQEQNLNWKPAVRIGNRWSRSKRSEEL